MPPLPFTEKIVLYVNDKHDMNQSMSKWFDERGIVAVRAGSTDRAMHWLLPPARVRFDAVITNLRRKETPGAPTNPNAGIELTQQIRRVNAHIPIFIYTLGVSPAIIMSARNSGVTHITTIQSEFRTALKDALNC